MTEQAMLDEPVKAAVLPPPDEAIVSEWRAAMKRGRERSQKQALRELGQVSAGVAVFFALFVLGLMILTKLFSLYVARELDHVSLADNARSLTVFLLGPVLLLVVPFSAAAFLIAALCKKRR